MINLKEVDTKDLISELLIREGVRSMEIEAGESYRVNAVTDINTKNRYLQGRGKVKILEIKI